MQYQLVYFRRGGPVPWSSLSRLSRLSYFVSCANEASGLFRPIPALLRQAVGRRKRSKGLPWMMIFVYIVEKGTR